eukprot:4295833-Prymnesium_polylepis.1
MAVDVATAAKVLQATAAFAHCVVAETITARANWRFKPGISNMAQSVHEELLATVSRLKLAARHLEPRVCVEQCRPSCPKISRRWR